MNKICLVNLGVEADFIFKVTLNKDDYDSDVLLDERNKAEAHVIQSDYIESVSDFEGPSEP